MHRKNWVGKRFGKLVIIADDDQVPGWRRMILVQCDCGKKKRVKSEALLRGNTTNCGCARGQGSRSHGMHGTRVYRSWYSAKARCNNPHFTGYENYGGRGICFSDRWNRFEDFLEDMGDRPKGRSLDRIDPDGHYEPGNCRWATPSMQRRNQRPTLKEPANRFRGVYRCGDKFSFTISVNNRKVRLGKFTDEVSAAKAYDKAAIRYHKEKAVTNAMLGRL